MRRHQLKVFCFAVLVAISGFIVLNMFTQSNGLYEACGIMGGDMYRAAGTGNLVCIKD